MATVKTVAKTVSTNKTSSSGSSGSGLSPYQAETFTPAQSQADSINNYYDEYVNAQKQQEKAAYDENVRALNYQAAKIAPQYKQQREALAAENEIAKQNFRRSAIARGINVGAGSQYALASQNNYQNNMTQLRRSEAQAMNDVEENRRQIMASYQAAVAQAVSNGNLNRAKALYDEAVRVDESIAATQRAQAAEAYNAWQSGYTVNRAEKDDENEQYDRLLTKAETLAQYGDFSGYKDLGYTDAQIRAMYNMWWQMTYGSSGSGGGGGGSSRRSRGSSSGSSSGAGVSVGRTAPVATSSAQASTISTGKSLGFAGTSNYGRGTAQGIDVNYMLNKAKGSTSGGGGGGKSVASMK